MGLYAWSARCIPGFSILVLLALTLLALTDADLPFQQSWHSAIHETGRRPPIKGPSRSAAPDITYSQLVFAAYNVLIHFLSLLFPLRLCWSLWQITGQVQDINSQHTTSLSNQITDDTKTRTVGSVGGSLSPIDTSRNEHRDDWPESPKGSSGMIYHAILIPIYKEETDTLRDTLDVLASHAQARTSYDVSPIRRCSHLWIRLTSRYLGLVGNGREGSQCREPSRHPHPGIFATISQHPFISPPLRSRWRSSGQEQQYQLGSTRSCKDLYRSCVSSKLRLHGDGWYVPLSVLGIFSVKAHVELLS